MLKKIILSVLFLSFLCLSGKTENPAVSIIPKPVKVKPGTGSFLINDHTRLLFAAGDEQAMNTARLFAGQLQLAGGPVLTALGVSTDYKNIPGIIFIIKKESPIPAEGYVLSVTKSNILIEGGDGAGLFYGMQTLLQLLPPEIFASKALQPGNNWSIPCITIRDHPRFPYRGMHLDVSRHFFPKEFVMKYIDLIASFKMNTFHWHLTDDNGWRIEIRKYPKLMQTSAWHVDRENLPWNERPPQKEGERATYGGYYTQDEIREVVEYAKKRYVTIIPEIEMPAHAVALLAAYPQFSCTGGPFTVPPGSYWPNTDILCAGNDSTFTFLEDVLTEVIGLFPSKYIHIGGDEADKTRWKECPKCQARIKAEGLKDEKELQSYFVKRIEKFLISKNRKMIGWDEILEGGLAPEATVMSWRGVEGGIAAARMGHDVVMTPGTHCYFDYYQANPKTEPKAIGGYITLKKVYSYEPIPGELTKEEAKYILGAQGNLWTEFIATPEHAEYMAIPRMIALAEVTWTPKSLKNWIDFRKRMDTEFRRLDLLKVNYCKGTDKVEITTCFDKSTRSIKYMFESEQPGYPIVYTLDGNDPTPSSSVYSGPIAINRNAYIKTGLLQDGKVGGLTERTYIFHKAIGKKVRYLEPYSYRYTAGGDEALVDGLRGTADFRQGNWQGFLGNNMDVIIDLGSIQPVRTVFVTFLQSTKSWIFFPDSVTFSLSANGKKFHSINEQLNTDPKKIDETVIKQFSQTFPDTPVRYVRVRAKSTGVCPPWHEGKGEPCWLFADEIAVF
ncbi:MAG: family 20 glycosylhydrolase [Bacteroidetes bacterium]|nr:family 20 glycosylhydrolase [Bacteroidota bacterium]